MNGSVYTLVWDGENLLLGGYFNLAGTLPASCAAVWNGASFSLLGMPGSDGLGGGSSPAVRKFLLSAGELHAAGSFGSAGSVTSLNVARTSMPALPDPVFDNSFE